MRYYGKEGPQCEPPQEENCCGMDRCRLAARAVLFGRVPRGVVLWLGLGLVGVTLILTLWSVSSVGSGGQPHLRDVGTAITIQR
jgi:hypothetical protein